jgi:coiled-coil domain-containing protein 130
MKFILYLALFSFELPFNIWCLRCERHLARGVRFNAEKKEIGKYYSTPIFSFRMKCPSCSNWIEIKTDPKNSEYQVTEGAKKKNEEYSVEEAGIGGTRLTEEESEKIEINPFFRLEHEARDLRKAQEQLPRLQSIQKAKDSAYKDDWAASRQARKLFREQKKKEQEEVKIEEAFKKRSGGLEIKLVAEDPEDLIMAKEIDFSSDFRESENKKRTLRNQKELEGLGKDPKTMKLKQFIKPK